MQSPPVPRSQRTIIVSLVVLALLGAGLLVWWRHGRTPAAEEVTAFLNRTVGGGRVRFSEVKMAALLQGEAGQQI